MLLEVNLRDLLANRAPCDGREEMRVRFQARNDGDPCNPLLAICVEQLFFNRSIQTMPLYCQCVWWYVRCFSSTGSPCGHRIPLAHEVTLARVSIIHPSSKKISLSKNLRARTSLRLERPGTRMAKILQEGNYNALHLIRFL